MDIEKIDHIGIAVRDLESALKVYASALGLVVKKIEEFKEYKVKIAFITIGEAMIELVQPTSADAPLAKRINEQGEGMYHLALKVKNIEAALREMKQNGIEMRDERPRPGGMGSLIAFSKPDATNNVSIELVERSEEV